MRAATYPLEVLLLTFSGWVSRHQQVVIEYLVEENRVLKEQMKGQNLRLTDNQRRRLAAKAKHLGRTGWASASSAPWRTRPVRLGGPMRR